MVEVSTSVLSVEENIAKTVYNLEVARTDYFHIDVMDGKFVKNNTYEKMLEYSNIIKQISNLPIDVHLMVEDVKNGILDFSGVEPNIITFHLEACKNKEEVFEYIKIIKEMGARVGISIRPSTDIEKIYEFLPYIHLVLIMTVEPGEGGQKMIPETVEKIKILKKYIDKNGIDLDIEVDGGINADTAKLVVEAGANILVSGSYIISSNNLKSAIESLKE